MRSDILVPIHTFPDGNVGGLASHVAAIAQHLNASVHALVLNADFPNVYSPLGGMLIDVPDLIAGAKARCRERGVTAVLALQTQMEILNVPLRITHVECFPAQAGDFVANIARYHDYTIVGIGPGEATKQATAEAVIFGAGRPTLLVPEDAPTSKFGHVMIGWDGSRVAARAVADARDLLQRAQAVTVALVTDEKALADENAGRHLAEHLARSGVTTTIAQVRCFGRPIAETLQQHAKEIGAGILVMGGFAHSRIRDFVIGGATNGVMRNLQLPVLLSH